MTNNGTFDIVVGDEKKGIAYDVNPITIDTDGECIHHLQDLKKTLNLSEKETVLLDSCLAVVSAKDGDDVKFGPSEIIALSKLAETYPTKALEIMACSHHISESVDCEGDLPPGFFLSMAATYGSLMDVMTAGLQMNDSKIPDEDFEENLSDNEDLNEETQNLNEEIQNLSLNQE